MYVVWNSKSFSWSINNFSEISGLKHSKQDGNEGDVGTLPNSDDEYKSLLDIDFVQSPYIDVGSKDYGTKGIWLIKLMKSREDTNSIDLHMELNQMGNEFGDIMETLSPYDCFFKYRIAIIGAEGLPVLEKVNETIVYMKSGSCWCEPGIIKLDFLRDNKDNVLHDGALKLKVDIFVLGDLHHSDPKTISPSVVGSEFFAIKRRKISGTVDSNDQMNSLQLTLGKQILSSLWKTRLNSDTVLACGDVQFPVHKSVLASASPVFAAAFTHNMTENEEGRITITDIGSSTLELLLRFIYCDASPAEPEWKSVDRLTDLLNAAEKYQLLTLKSLCFSKLCEELTLNNAAQITVLVYLFEPDDWVKKFVYQYVIGNISILKAMETFKTKVQETPAAFTPLLLLLGND
ncbi:Speckle-type POZ protein [Orchesella cincta]|uniref:Speckle-type POZ protein n=1 Tax=Orchesella cincta TaxID=48709 RepID=A0A1D2NE15_ORCCI|nr:Speckle-type POZ protein [Orchesella cincta]